MSRETQISRLPLQRLRHCSPCVSSCESRALARYSSTVAGEQASETFSNSGSSDRVPLALCPPSPPTGRPEVARAFARLKRSRPRLKLLASCMCSVRRSQRSLMCLHTAAWSWLVSRSSAGSRLPSGLRFANFHFVGEVVSTRSPPASKVLSVGTAP